jgi:hypothetical protein
MTGIIKAVRNNRRYTSTRAKYEIEIGNILQNMAHYKNNYKNNNVYIYNMYMYTIITLKISLFNRSVVT